MSQMKYSPSLVKSNIYELCNDVVLVELTGFIYCKILRRPTFRACRGQRSEIKVIPEFISIAQDYL